MIVKRDAMSETRSVVVREVRLFYREYVLSVPKDYDTDDLNFEEIEQQIYDEYGHSGNWCRPDIEENDDHWFVNETDIERVDFVMDVEGRLTPKEITNE